MKHIYHSFMQILFVAFATCAMSACNKDDDDDPSNGYNERLITKIVKQYNDEAYASDTYVFSYDNKRRVIQRVNPEDDTDYRKINISYGENKVFFEEGYYWSCEITLENGRATSGSFSYHCGEAESYEPYTLGYDANGRLIESIRPEEKNFRYSITWTNGNPTAVKYKSYNGGEYIECTDKAEYGNVPNKTNIDLNWMVLTECPSGWIGATGDGDQMPVFALLGYLGKRSANLAEKITNSSSGEVLATITYELDSEKYPTRIVMRKGDYVCTYTISYNK